MDPFIIAECGVNWTSLDEAEAMIYLAAEAGADAVKFQVYDNTQTLGHIHELQLERIRLNLDNLKRLKTYSDNIGIEFMATPMYLGAAEMLEMINVTRYKIREADCENIALFDVIINTGKQVIISSNQIPFNLSLLIREEKLRPNLDFVHMYCIPKYPPKPLDFHGSPILYCKEGYYGYSNHYPTPEACIIAAARGCKFFEMHVKLNNTIPLDDAVSLTFEELADTIIKIKQISLYVGDGI